MSLNKLITGSSLILIGFALIGFGVSFKWFVFPSIIENVIYGQLELKEGTAGWDAWVNPPVPVYMNFYFMHVLNPDEVKMGEKPHLMEVGPYSFTEERIKKNILPIGVNDLNYDLAFEYHYNQENTDRLNCVPPPGTVGPSCSRDDKLTVLNPVLASIVSILPTDLGAIQQSAVNRLVENFNKALTNATVCGPDCLDDFTMTESVIDMLFDGFSPGSLKAIKWALQNTSGIDFILDLLGISVEDIPETIYFFMGTNGTTTEFYTINHGRYEKHMLLNIEKFNGMTELPEHWWSKAPASPSAKDAGMEGICRAITGTDGTQFPPFLEKNEPKWMFVSQLCRSIWVDFIQETTFNGIPCYEYRPGDEVFDMSYPNNYCYCPFFEECAEPVPGKDEWNMTNCLEVCPDGAIQVAKCYGGAPIVMSAPHFLRGASELLNAVEGLNPDFDKHDTLLFLEPMSGAPLAAHKRIMISVDVKQDSRVDATSNIRSLFFPFLWADETAEIDEPTEKEIKFALNVPFTIVDVICIGLGLVIGSLMVIGGIVLCVLSAKTHRLMPKETRGASKKIYAM